MSFCMATYRNNGFIIGADTRINYSDSTHYDNYRKIYSFDTIKAGIFCHNLGTFFIKGEKYTFTDLMGDFETDNDCSALTLEEMNSKVAFLIGAGAVSTGIPVYFTICGFEKTGKLSVPVLYRTSIENGIINTIKIIARECWSYYGGEYESVRLAETRELLPTEDHLQFVSRQVNQAILEDKTGSIGGDIDTIVVNLD